MAAAGHPFLDRPELERAVRELWSGAAHREERYAATALLDTQAARAVRSPESLELYRELIVSGAWWDHVDELAHRVGELRIGWPRDDAPITMEGPAAFVFEGSYPEGGHGR